MINNINLLTLLGSIVFVISFRIILSMGFKIEKKDVKKINNRLKQMKNFNQDNVVRNTIDAQIIDKMKYDKKKKLEKLISQSGLKLSLIDYYILSILMSVGFSLLSMMMLGNIFVSITMIFVGMMIPRQVVVFVRNKRVKKFESQVGAFIRITVKRYQVINDFAEAIRLSVSDFEGQEPISGELKLVLSDIEVGTSPCDALVQMGDRTANRYVKLLANNYKVSNSIGTQEMKEKMLNSVVSKYDKDIKTSSKLKREISTPIVESFLITTLVPAVVIMQMSFDPTYIDFITKDILGKASLGAVSILVFISIWITVNKVAAPLNDEEL